MGDRTPTTAAGRWAAETGGAGGRDPSPTADPPAEPRWVNFVGPGGLLYTALTYATKVVGEIAPEDVDEYVARYGRFVPDRHQFAPSRRRAASSESVRSCDAGRKPLRTAPGAARGTARGEG